jgi:hypothetical protein
MTRRSTSQNEEIRRTAVDIGIAEDHSQIRRNRDPSDVPMTKKSGARSIAPMDMIWKSVNFFWIAKECRHQQRWHLKIPAGESIVERPLTEMSIWQRST